MIYLHLLAGITSYAAIVNQGLLTGENLDSHL